MEKLTELFKLIELTRSQPQYGYSLAGISKFDLSDLAAHHYLVTFFAWQLAANLKAKGAKIDVQRVMELALSHDLGELFGGDIAMPYARANPKARKLAKNFEQENFKFLSAFFGSQSAAFHKSLPEIMEPKSDEGLVVKCADYMEVTYFKYYLGRLTKGDVKMAEKSLLSKAFKLKDAISKKEMVEYIKKWSKEMAESKPREFFENSKNL